ncbi:hypothetical protein SUGI_0663590 [Cryptomeria japonica]|nr:hypothetical protein SUGI_0663590 [Cryptomeria japonica]
MGEIREKFCLSLFFVSIVFIQLKSYGVVVEGEDILSLGASITGNQTLISKNGTFELGFFSPNGTNNWYIGIWYANIPEKTVVWVANRETPARNRCGVLKLSEEGDLGLFDATGASLWSVNVTKKPSQALILDSGNFVMLSNDNKSETVWQSFDYPVDTFLPGMRFGGQKKLVSWKSSLDPAPGLFSYQVDPSSGVKQLVLKWNNSVEYWASGPWDGNVFSQIPEMSNKALYNISVEIINSGFHVTYTSIAIKNVLSRSVTYTSIAIYIDSYQECNYMLCLMTLNGPSSGLNREINVPYMVCAALTESATPTIFSSAAAWKGSLPKTLEPGIRETRGQVAVFDRAR